MARYYGAEKESSKLKLLVTTTRANQAGLRSNNCDFKQRRCGFTSHEGDTRCMQVRRGDRVKSNNRVFLNCLVEILCAGRCCADLVEEGMARFG